MSEFDEVRARAAAPEFRAANAGEDGIGLLTGYFSKFDNWYRVSSVFEGDFMERTAPGFAAQTIAEDGPSMRVLFNHGFDSQVGDKVLGMPRTIREDDVGPYYEVPLFDTSYNRDLLPGLKVGAYGASFRMRVLEDSWNDEPKPSKDNPKGLPERTITRAQVMEFGPVTFPANPEASASVRSTTDEFYDKLRHRDTARFEAAVRAAGRNPFDLADLNARSVRVGGSTDVPGQGAAQEGNAKSGNGRASARTEAEARHIKFLTEGIIHA